MRKHAGRAAPEEACGVLFGRYNARGVAVVHGLARLANVSSKPTHAYEFAPDQQAATWDDVRRMDLEVLAVWHSHPEGPPHPSGTDLEYMQPWLLYAVLSRDPARPGLEAVFQVWRLASGTPGYEEVPVRALAEG